MHDVSGRVTCKRRRAESRDQLVVRSDGSGVPEQSAWPALVSRRDARTPRDASNVKHVRDPLEWVASVSAPCSAVGLPQKSYAKVDDVTNELAFFARL